MPSITLMMSEMRRLDSLMPFMVSTTWPTTSPPSIATLEALMANWLAWRAESAFCFTVEPSSSMLAAVCFQRAGLAFGAAGEVVVALGNLGAGGGYAF